MDDEMLLKMARKYPDYYQNLVGEIPYQEWLEAGYEDPYFYGEYIANQIWDIVQEDELDVVAVDKLVKEYAELDEKIGGSANDDLRYLVNELKRRANLKRNHT